MSILLQRRVKKLLENQAEMESSMHFLETLPSFVDVGGPTALSNDATSDLRGTLKSQLDNASLSVAQGVLDEMDAMLASIVHLKTHADAMDSKCRHVLSFLDSAERTSTQFIAQATALMYVQ